ncbi:MAG: ATP-grasp domain-containing protein, partial [Desulfobacterales bacterium]
MLWAESIGVPVPKTFVIKNLNDLIAAANQINFPVVIKNPDSFASEGLWTCSDGAEKLLEEYKRRIPQIVTGVEREFPIIQKKITGQLFDSTSFVIKGQTVGMLTQERILTAWLDGGGGLVNITNDIPEIKEYTQKIIKELKWTGPIEMDWIKDSDSGRYYLIEINPKFWGTTQLTISSGLDYPDFLMRFATNKPIKKISEYKIGLMYRWIMDELFAILTMSQNRQRLFAE